MTPFNNLNAKGSPINKSKGRGRSLNFSAIYKFFKCEKFCGEKSRGGSGNPIFFIVIAVNFMLRLSDSFVFAVCKTFSKSGLVMHSVAGL